VLENARLAVVVPACNEEAWIAETVRRMPAYVDHVIVVDDASRDATGEEALAVGDPRVEVIRHAENRGVGAAIVTGYRRARALGADVVAVMAGDGQMHPDDLAAVVLPAARGEADYVKGNRLAHPEVWRTMPPARLAGTAALAWLTQKAAGLDRLSDSQCGFTAITARAIDTLGEELDALWPRYGYPNDLIGALARHGLTIEEVVVRPVYRGEASGLRAWHLATIGYLIGRIAWRRLAAPARAAAVAEAS
jgi:glycosyltransferase involved in cell wall biosynthesis